MSSNKFKVIKGVAVLADGTKVSISCESCIWYKGNERCTAYLDQIPPQILSGQDLHTTAFWNDRGIQYEPNIATSAPSSTKSVDQQETKKLGATLRSAARFATARFDPDAIDGDEDGLVQDGTAFERPALPNVNVQMPSRRTERRQRIQESPRQSAKPSKQVEEVIDSTKTPQQKLQVVRDWLDKNPGYYSEVSVVEQARLAQRLQQRGRRGFASATGPVGSGGREAGKKILDKVRPEHRNKPKKRLFFIGGTTGAGKSTIIKDDKISIPGDTEAAHIDPDEIKKGLVGYDGGKGASRVHEASRTATDRVMQDAMSQGMDMVVQGTGKRTEHLQMAKRAGYETVGHFVYVPGQLADKRIAQRNANNKVNGGPILPEYFGSQIAGELGMIVPRQITSGLFDEFYLWDNRGDTPKLIAYRKKDGSYAINDDKAFDDFMSPAGAKYVRQYWASGNAPSGNTPRRGFASSSKTPNRDTEPLDLSLEDIIDRHGRDEEADGPRKVVFGAGIPVPIQHVTGKDGAESIVEKGYDLSQAGSKHGSMYGHGIYLNVEGDGMGMVWANSTTDPVSLAGTFTPQKPLVLSDMDINDIQQMPVAEFLRQFENSDPRKFSDTVRKLAEQKTQEFLDWIDEHKVIADAFRRQGIDPSVYPRTAAGLKAFFDDSNDALSDMSSPFLSGLHNGEIITEGGETIQLSSILKNEAEAKMLDWWIASGRKNLQTLMARLDKLNNPESSSSVDMIDFFWDYIQGYVPEVYDSLITRGDQNSPDSYQMVAYNSDIVKFSGFRQLWGPREYDDDMIG